MTLTFKNSYIQEKKFNPCIQRVSVLKAIDTLGNFNNRYFFTNSNKTDDCALKIENYRENDHRKIITMILILCYVDLAITAGYAWFGCLLVKHLSFLNFFFNLCVICTYWSVRTGCRQQSCDWAPCLMSYDPTRGWRPCDPTRGLRWSCDLSPPPCCRIRRTFLSGGGLGCGGGGGGPCSRPCRSSPGRSLSDG